MTDSTNLTRDIKDCMERAGSPLSDDQYMLFAGYLEERQSHASSAAWLLEMADCLNECLDQVNEAITAAMRAGNRGVLTVNGQKLTPGEVSQRLEYLSQQRDRILKALNPQRTTNTPPDRIK
ncbi:hypothetical protein [Marinobacter phage PS3]|nr:hypothetical protein [Marinobacter phage PS3]